MTQISFSVSARTARLIGQENFAHAEGAIIELVKNSYDADAKIALVVFDNQSKDRSDHSLYIIDNGHGMTENVVINQWMKIGTNNKEVDFTSEIGRIKTGAKGIGRFALDRLGTNTEMITAAIDYENLIHWSMDWLQFEEIDKSLSDINATIEPISGISFIDYFKTNINSLKVNQIIEDFDFSKGTIIRISNLRDSWDQNGIEKLFKSLEALIPPIDIEIFNVYVLALNNINQYGKVSTAFFNEYDYRVESEYISNELNVKIKITRDELDINRIKTHYSDIFIGRKPPFDIETLQSKTFYYERKITNILKWKEDQGADILKKVGDFKFTFYFLKRSEEKKEMERYPYKISNYAERKLILDRFGGVKIYRDSFRVRPYGEPGDDWLDLGKREAASPGGPGQTIGAWRVRSSQIAGSIQISRITNASLIDKSDRNSLIENETFTAFKNVIIGIISEFELDRSKISNPFYLRWKKLKAEQDDLKINEKAQELAIEIVKNQQRDNFSSDEEQKKQQNYYEESFKQAFKQFNNPVENEEEASEIATLRGLASLGIIVSSSAHELRGLRNNLIPDIEDLKEVIEKEIDINKYLFQPNDDNPFFILKGIQNDHEKLEHWLNYALTGINRDKRKRTNLNFSDYFKTLASSWQNSLNQKNITLKLNPSKDCIIRAFEIDIDTIFNNLISNTIDAFNEYSQIVNRLIIIEWVKKDEKIVINYRDNGPGLSEVFSDPNEIFLPFVSSKRDETGNQIGTGLGMYLVKQVIEAYNGNVKIINNSGFDIEIEFSIKK